MTLLITCNFYFFLCNISHFFCTLSLLCEVFTRASFLKNTLNVPVSANLPFVILMKAAQSDRNVDRKTTEWRLVLGLIKKKTSADEAASSLKHTIASTMHCCSRPRQVWCLSGKWHQNCQKTSSTGKNTAKCQQIQQSVNKNYSAYNCAWGETIKVQSRLHHEQQEEKKLRLWLLFASKDHGHYLFNKRQTMIDKGPTAFFFSPTTDFKTWDVSGPLWVPSSDRQSTKR